MVIFEKKGVLNIQGDLRTAAGTTCETINVKYPMHQDPKTVEAGSNIGWALWNQCVMC